MAESDTSWWQEIINAYESGGITEVATQAIEGLEDFIPGTTITDNDLTQSRYDFNFKTFPSDLGNEDVGHYMVININVPAKNTTDFNNAEPRTNFPQFQSFLPSDASKVDILRFNEGLTNFGQRAGVGGDREALSVPRNTRRIAESIALHMPASIVHTSFNDYPDISLTALGGGLLTGFAKSAATIAGSIGGSIFGPGGAVVGGTTGGAIVDGVTGYINSAARIAGYPINPRVEVLFASTRQKQYMFEVLLTPRNPLESIAVNQIIKTLRYHSAPEIDTKFAGFTFIPPAEFDITFFNKGKENLEMPRINTCVMERLDIDYAPFGGMYTTFKNGAPLGVRLSMGFREIEITHKLRVLQGF
jgi:hypothetical protein